MVTPSQIPIHYIVELVKIQLLILYGAFIMINLLLSSLVVPLLFDKHGYIINCFPDFINHAFSIYLWDDPIRKKDLVIVK